MNFFTICGVAASLCAVVAPLARSASDGAVTDPVGFTKITIPGGNGSTAGSKIIGFSLQEINVAAGALTDVSSNNLTDSAAAWTTALNSTPHLVRLVSGTGTGRTFLITGATDTQITVASEGSDLSTIARPGDSYQIFPAHTLGTLFGTSTVPFLSNADYTLADNVLIWDSGHYETYFHDGFSWKKVGSEVPQDDAVIYPEEALFVVRRGMTSITLTLIGAVPTTDLKMVIPGSGGTMIANRFPLTRAIRDLGLHTLSGWTSNADYTRADTLLLWNGANWETFWHDGTHWFKVGSFREQDAAVIGEGCGYLIRRRDSATGQDIIVHQPIPYNL
jgi:uncharacterized protein (TIGR02597 family)